MSAPIHSLVADYLNVSDENARKLLTAMLREVNKRAHQSGVRLPEFGTFRERDGQLTFEPSESLARAVNRRFEGLESEDLASAPQEEEQQKQQSEGPSTITLGYQDASGWSPLDAEDETESEKKEDEEEKEEEEDSEPDTAEFQVPSADEAADTTELQTSETAANAAPSASDTESQESQRTDRSTDAQDSEPRRSESPPSEPKPSDRSRAEERSGSGRAAEADDTGGQPASPSSSASRRESSSENTQDDDDLYPLVDDTPNDRSEPDPRSSRDRSINEAERESLSDIWNSETVGEMRSAQEKAESESFSAPGDDEDPEAPPRESPDFDSTPPTGQAPPEQAQESAEKDKSSGARVFVTLLLLLFLGGAAWYILGQRGMVQRPGTTLSALNTQVQSFMGSPSRSQSQDETSSSTDDQTENASDTESGSASSPSDETGGDEQTSDATSSAINPDAGGFTIVVASRSNESGARSIRDTYRQRMSGEGVAVDMIPSSVDNTTRYRIGIGQFDNRSEAEAALEKFSSRLPDGAWILGL